MILVRFRIYIVNYSSVTSRKDKMCTVDDDVRFQTICESYLLGSQNYYDVRELN